MDRTLPRAVWLLLLGGTIVPFATDAWGPAMFLGWGLTALAFLASYPVPPARRAAWAAFATLVALVLATASGFGLTVGRAGASPTVPWEAFAGATVLASVWLPAGVFVALGPPDRASRIGAIGAGAMALWVALFAGVLLLDGDAHGRVSGRIEGAIVLFVSGALLVTGVLAWRVARPPGRD